MHWLRLMRIERGLKIPNIFNNLILKKSCVYINLHVYLYCYVVRPESVTLSLDEGVSYVD